MGIDHNSQKERFMFTYYLKYEIHRRSLTSEVVHFDDFTIEADSISDALDEFWDYVNPIVNSSHAINIRYMFKEVHPDTYSNDRYCFSMEV